METFTNEDQKMGGINKYFQNKKVLAGVFGVAIFIIPLIIFMIRGSRQQQSTQSIIPTPFNARSSTSSGREITPPPAFRTASLSFKKESATSTAVVVDTKNKPISAVQLSISFDPSILQNVNILPGNFFAKALVLMHTIDYASGTIFYAAVVPPDASLKEGKGVIAHLSYTFAQGAINPTTLQFLPNTKIAARGVDDSVLKQASSITIAAN